VVVPFYKVSNVFINALIGHEDSRFYKHHGIDPSNSTGTITQKLMNHTYNLSDSIYDKLVRDFLALRIETELSKEEILEAYVNRIYFGSGTYGIEAASQTYFGKPASNLNLPEAATLAGLIRRQNRFSPLNNPDGSLRERNTVLGRMRDLGFITTLEYDEASASPLIAMPLIKTLPKDN
jgi:membrane peptidoglycan carboxypeptidase